ncbi:MAG: hypothetical protein OQJ96_08810 [Flavobacteriales bacterium]|jgi:hypothetical protein|nr:hypothetical protein [Flavobacteriales bacterium]MCW8913487.1 hypothetical protein [Flavobacteriales bacterium]MCW8937320.1 hypothetical protein [Flavobacteriales bacterium]MCW8940232.1 hypothetical protein [Flavobacteriales bacterium]MCW8969048.1 hypothetical protein [Flavobacteriales bacterium]
MTPFIVWLEKNEIDELITIMAKSSKAKKINNEIYSTDELINLTENLLQQNDKLIEILKKITPIKSYKDTINDTIIATRKQKSFMTEIISEKLNKKT